MTHGQVVEALGVSRRNSCRLLYATKADSLLETRQVAEAEAPLDGCTRFLGG